MNKLLINDRIKILIQISGLLFSVFMFAIQVSHDRNFGYHHKWIHGLGSSGSTSGHYKRRDARSFIRRSIRCAYIANCRHAQLGQEKFLFIRVRLPNEIRWLPTGKVIYDFRSSIVSNLVLIIYLLFIAFNPSCSNKLKKFFIATII